MFKYFHKSIAFTIAALALAFAIGLLESGHLGAALVDLFVAAVLGVMETSLSLDNAVANSKVLQTMDVQWQERFVNWGIWIAVVGMRIIFPLAIVGLSAWVNPIEAIRIALFDHARYQEIITGAHVAIAGFGGAFLALVGQTFFFDPDREHHWIAPIEKPLCTLGRLPYATYVLTGIEAIAASFLVEGHAQQTFILAAAAGIASFALVKWLGSLLEGDDDGDNAAAAVARAGIGGFLYLEILDASFSFDGVIGAFAVTNDILIIALGLGIGAMFVRSMTVALVKGGVLNDYRYLEPGAFYAIASLAGIMFLSIGFEIPELVSGLLGAFFITTAFLASVRHRRLYPDDYAEEVEMITPTGDVIPAKVA